MLTYKDCLEVSDLHQSEVDAVGEHEHLQGLPALAECEHMLHTDQGVRRIQHMIVDDIQHAQRAGKLQHARDLRRVLTRFTKHHPCGAGH